MEVTIAGVHLEHPVMNAAGTCKLLDAGEGEIDVRKLARSPVAAIMVGSITLEPRAGNSGNVYYTEPGFSLNSLGLPNPGAGYYEKHLPEMVEIAHAAGKPLFVSVAGFNPAEYAELAELALEGGADFVELNFGCPNVWDGSRQKQITSFNQEAVYVTLHVVQERIGKNVKAGVKLSPFSDPFSLIEVAAVIGDCEMIKVVVSANTFPNAFAADGSGAPYITPADGLAGMAGSALKPVGLGQVKQLRNLLPPRIQLVGVGGVSSAQDVRDYQRVGAQAVQVGTALLNRGLGLFTDILTELVDMAEVA